MLKTVLRGLAAGSAGVTALNTVTYLDMAVRGRPASSAPEDLVEKAVRSAGGDVPGDGDTRDNRLQGLGPLSGIGAGVGVGALASLVHRYIGHLPKPLGIVTLGLGAMLLSDGPLVAGGLTDPRTWTAQDWASDVLPHLVYGWATYEVLAALETAAAAGTATKLELA